MAKPFKGRLGGICPPRGFQGRVWGATPPQGGSWRAKEVMRKTGGDPIPWIAKRFFLVKRFWAFVFVEKPSFHSVLEFRKSAGAFVFLTFTSIQETIIRKNTQN